MFGLTWCTTTFRYLGIWFSYNANDMEYKNFRHRLDKIRNLLKIWFQRDLSLRGKVTILRSLALSQLLFPMGLLDCPLWAMSEAYDLFFKFLWSGKPDKIKRSTVIRNIEQGGLKMVDVDVMARAMKAKWCAKMYQEPDSKWCNIASLFFGKTSLVSFIRSNYDVAVIPSALPMFYKQCLNALSEVRYTNFNDYKVLLSQCLWYNINIQVRGKPLVYLDWIENGICFVHDLMGNDMKFLKPHDLFQKYTLRPTNNNLLRLFSLKSAIPKAWKDIIKRDHTSINDDLTDFENDIMVLCGNVERNISFVSNKDIYWAIISRKTKDMVTSQYMWQNDYKVSPELMKKYNYVPYTYIQDCKIQSMQYKILHNVYPCGLKLYQWKIFTNAKCRDCGIIDNLSHHFYHCHHMVIFWNSVKNWWRNICTECSIATELQVLLGTVDKSCHKPQLNYITLAAKWYIYRTKYLEQKCCFLDFMVELKSRIKIEERVYYTKGQFGKFLDIWYEAQCLL